MTIYIGENQVGVTRQAEVDGATAVPTPDKIAKFNPAARMNSADMSSQEVENFIDSLDLNRNILDFFYPVGSIYQTVDDGFNPNIRWGGTWELIEEGRFLQATETSQTGGDEVEAGLPNITGGFTSRATNYNASPTMYPDNGANFIAYSQGGLNADGVNQVNGAVTGWHYTFNASRVSSVYGNSTTVQPPAIKVYMWHRSA